MTAATPGQVPREALEAEVREAVTGHCTANGPCPFCEAEIGRTMKAADDYAQAAIAAQDARPAPELAAAMAQVDDLREELATIRERLGNLAAGLELSAAATAPSKKSSTERSCAAAVRAIAELP